MYFVVCQACYHLRVSFVFAVSCCAVGHSIETETIKTSQRTRSVLERSALPPLLIAPDYPPQSLPISSEFEEHLCYIYSLMPETGLRKL